jgi:hypothetical protein
MTIEVKDWDQLTSIYHDAFDLVAEERPGQRFLN